jgi:PAS domain-containing protein
MHHDDQNERRELVLESIDEAGALEVLRALPAGVLLVDGQGRVVFMNPTAADLVGNVIQRELVELSTLFGERSRAGARSRSW